MIERHYSSARPLSVHAISHQWKKCRVPVVYIVMPAS
jgi:hypothetical protein